MSINVHINGDRSLFKSKNAINRFKSDLKKTDVSVHLEVNKYFLENCDYKLEVNESNYNVEVIKKIDKNYEKNELKKKLRSKIKSYRSSNMNRKLKTMKKEIPKGLFNSFIKLKKNMPNLPIDSPDEILKNPEKHKETFRRLAENISKDDLNSGDPYKSYLVKLIKELGLEESLGKKKSNVPEIPKDLRFEVLDEFVDKSKFIESDKFDGAKEGYVFKKGSLGLGYYPDKINDVSVD